MKYIDSWLTGLGLDYIIPKLKENGITTPKKLAQLSLREMYEVGVEDPEDRKKLYFLIQRLQMILNKDGPPNQNSQEAEPDEIRSDDEDPVDRQQVIDSSEEDLKALRRRPRISEEPADSIFPQHSEDIPSPPQQLQQHIPKGPQKLPYSSRPPPTATNPHREETNENSKLTGNRATGLHPRMHSPIIFDRPSPPKPVVAAPPGSQKGALVRGSSRSEDVDRMHDPVPFEEQEVPSQGLLHTRQYEDMAIRVVVRKRPISRAELGRGDRDVMEILDNGTVMVHEPKTKVDLTKIIETQSFIFDDAFEADETNELIYSRTIGHLVPFVFEGGKASCFAYGQTGSGKTFTMMGARPDAPAEAVVNAGLYVLAARDVFSQLSSPQYRSLQVYVSCFEIYSGKLFDLLNDRGVVKCLEDSKQQVQLPGLTEHHVATVEELLALMALAHSQRSTGCTGANAASSRSHQVMQLVLKEMVAPAAPTRAGAVPRRRSQLAPQPQVPQQRGKLSFIDLAGSERGADTGNSSKQTRLEGAEINTSLLALKEVIRSLQKHGHTPFRGSKLTQVLKDSFVGERTRTCMVACVSPSHSNCEHTLNTLRYADRVKEHQASNGPAPNGGGGGGGGVGAPEQPSITPPPHIIRPGTTPSTRPVSSGGAVKPAATGTPGGRDFESFPADGDSMYAQRPATTGSEVGGGSGSGGAVTSRRQSAGGSAQKRDAIQNGQALAGRAKSVAGPQNRRLSAPLQQPSYESLYQEELPVSEPAQVSVPASRLAQRAQFSKEDESRRLQLARAEQLEREQEQLVRAQVEAQTRAKAAQAEILQRNQDMLSLHKKSIAEMVEVMKDEMELVQEMETKGDRDLEAYIEQLELLLDAKDEAITSLKAEVSRFQQYRTAVSSRSGGGRGGGAGAGGGGVRLPRR